MNDGRGRRNRKLAARLVLMARGAASRSASRSCRCTTWPARSPASAAARSSRVQARREGQVPATDAHGHRGVRRRPSPAGGWTFEPVAATMEVQPGQLYETHYRARNLAERRDLVGRPCRAWRRRARRATSTRPSASASRRSSSPAGEEREMPVRFIVDPSLPAEASTTLTLSYTFYDIGPANGRQLRRPSIGVEARHMHPRPARRQYYVPHGSQLADLRLDRAVHPDGAAPRAGSERVTAGPWVLTSSACCDALRACCSAGSAR